MVLEMMGTSRDFVSLFGTSYHITGFSFMLYLVICEHHPLHEGTAYIERRRGNLAKVFHSIIVYGEPDHLCAGTRGRCTYRLPSTHLKQERSP